MMWMLFGIDRFLCEEDPNLYSVTSVSFIETTEEWGLQNVNGGFGHDGAQNDLTLHFSLDSSSVGAVRVRWSKASLNEEEYPVSGNQLLNIVQGEELDAS